MRRLEFSVLALAFALAAAANPATAATGAKQKSFATPEEAVKQLAAAARSGDSRALVEILGPDAKAIVASGDPVTDKKSRERFARAYDEANKLERSGDARAVLSVGKDEWTFPIPIVKDAAGWRFDTKAGKEEILNRRIGRNEHHAIQAALAYVDAQREYYLRNPQNDKMLHYAQKFMSASGKRDGLYWPARPIRAAGPTPTRATSTASSRDRARRRAAAPTITWCKGG